MKVNELNEGVAAVKLRSIKKQGEVVYDGDPKGYEWKPSQIKNYFDTIGSLLGKMSRNFDRLIITKWSNTKYFLAISSGTPEVVYYFYYDAYGHNTYVYIDWLKIKTKEFLALSQDEQLKLLSTTVQPDPAAIWKKERSIEVIGAAFETMDKDAVDKVIDSIGSKFIATINKLECDSASIHKLAEFVRSLDKVNTKKTKELANVAIQTFKKKVLVDLQQEIKELRFGPISVIQKIGLLRKSGFKWSELDAMELKLQSAAIKQLLKDIKSPYFDPAKTLSLVTKLKNYGYKWPELDIIEKSLRVGNKQISEDFDLNSVGEAGQIVAVQKYGWNLRQIKNPSEAVQVAAVTADPWSIEYIRKPSEKVQIAFVKRVPWGIQYLDNPSEKVKMAAVSTFNPTSAIKFIANPSEELQLASVKTNPESIKNIKKPSKDVILIAILKMIKDGEPPSRLNPIYDRWKKKFPNWPEWEMIERSRGQDKLVKEDSEEEAKHLAQINKYPNYIKYIPNPSEAVQIAAVKKYPPALGNIKEPCKAAYITSMLAAIKADQPEFAISVYMWVNEHHPDWPELAGIEQALRSSKLIKEAVDLNTASEDEQIAAINDDFRVFKSIKNPSEAVQLAAVKQYGPMLQYIKNPSDAVQLAAVKQNGAAIIHVKNPTKETEMAAVSIDGFLIRHIKNPDAEIQLTAMRKTPDALDYIKHPANKTIIMVGLLGWIKKYGETAVSPRFISCYNYYKSQYPHWPEWATMNKSVRAIQEK